MGVLDGFISEKTRIPWSYQLGERPAILLGRALAVCAHPSAAWRVLPTPWRWWIVVAYVVAAYAATLSTLFLLGVL